MLKYENNDVFTGTFDHGVLNRKGRLALAEENGLATHGTKVSHVVTILTERINKIKEISFFYYNYFQMKFYRLLGKWIDGRRNES